jgi:hypothetical protein
MIQVTTIEMKPPTSFMILLERHGYSKKIIKEVWKWYDFSKKKGAANF